MEVGGINYLIPTDAKIAVDRDIGFEAVPLEQVLNAAERAKKLRLVILDACRVNPFANQMKRTQTVASRSVSRGLAAVEPEAGTLVVYAAKDGETALDGDGINSPFASAFVKFQCPASKSAGYSISFATTSWRRPVASKSLLATARSLEGRTFISWQAIPILRGRGSTRLKPQRTARCRTTSRPVSRHPRLKAMRPRTAHPWLRA